MVVVGAVASGVMWVAKPWIAQAIEDVFVPCAQSVQVKALTTPELLAPYRTLANQFEDAAAERNGDCRPMEVHVSAMPAPGKVAFMRNWPVAFRNLQSLAADDANQPAFFAVAALPGPSVLGGQNLAVSSKSTKPINNAKLRPVTPCYIRFAETFRGIVRPMLLSGGGLPPDATQRLTDALEC